MSARPKGVRPPEFWAGLLWDRWFHEKAGIESKQWTRLAWAHWIAGTVKAIQTDAVKATLRAANEAVAKQLEAVCGEPDKALLVGCPCFYHQAARTVRALGASVRYEPGGKIPHP